MIHDLNDPCLKVDWSVWKLKATVTLKEACCLSLEVNPENDYELIQEKSKQGEYTNTELYNLASEVAKRIEICIANLPGRGGNLPVFKRLPDPYGSIGLPGRVLVKLPEFGSWIASKGLNLPDKFPIAEIKIMESQDNLSEKERNSLLKMILGMALDAYQYKPENDRNTATGENKGSIYAACQEYKIDISNDTIKKYLNEAKDFFYIPNKKS